MGDLHEEPLKPLGAILPKGANNFLPMMLTGDSLSGGVHLMPFQVFPDWKNISDQTYSCPRDWRFSES